MKKDRARKVFFVECKKLEFRVRIMDDVPAVDREYKRTHTDKDKRYTQAFFSANLSPNAQYVGTIVLPLTEKLEDLIPHEVFHGVLHHFVSVHRSDDEAFAHILGVVSAKIYNKIRKHFYAFDDEPT